MTVVSDNLSIWAENFEQKGQNRYRLLAGVFLFFLKDINDFFRFGRVVRRVGMVIALKQVCKKDLTEKAFLCYLSDTVLRFMTVRKGRCDLG